MRIKTWTLLFTVIPALLSIQGCMDVSDKDKTPPQVANVTPSNGAANVPINARPTIVFSESVNTLSVQEGVKLSARGVSVPASISYDTNNHTATIIPESTLNDSTLYTAKATTAIKDHDANRLPSTYEWSFTTVDLTPPSVSTSSITDGEVDVATDSTFTVTFSEPLNATTVTSSTITLTSSSGSVATNISYDNSTRTVTLTPTAALIEGVDYTLTATTGIEDLNGLAIAADHAINFTTIDTPPSVASTNIQDGDSGIARDTTITATFDQNILASTVDSTSVKLNSPAGSVSGSVTTDTSPSALTVTFTPSSSLALGTPYSFTLSTAITDENGNHLQTEYSLSFTTVDGSWGGRTSVDTSGTGVYDSTRIDMFNTGTAFLSWLEPSASNALHSVIDGQSSVWSINGGFDIATFDDGSAFSAHVGLDGVKKIYIASHASGTWTADGIISDNTTYNATNPKAASSKDGTAIVAWEEINPDSQADIKASIYSSGAWSTPYLVDTTIYNATLYGVGMDDSGNAHVLYKQNDGLSDKAWVAKYTSGGTWTRHKAIFSDNSDYTSTSASLDVTNNGKAAISIIDNGTSAWVASYDPQTGWADATSEFGTGTFTNAKVGIADSGVIIAAVQETFGSDYVLTNLYSPTNGWETAARVSSTPLENGVYDLVMGKYGNATCVLNMRNSSNGLVDTYASRRRNSTAWSSPVQLSDANTIGESLVNDISMTTDGIVGVVWSSDFSSGSVHTNFFQ